MILIADCGSTKIDWCLLNGKKVEKQVFTMGMNAVMLTEEEMRGRIGAELMPELADYAAEIKEVYFYGAGCISTEVCSNVACAIKANLPEADKIEVYTDLLAAARALCGHEPGIACIMGTGSNSCLYDGTGISANVSPLGFILGDEGSGAVLGKLFLGDVLKNQLPATVRAEFLEEYSLDLLTIIRRVYREPQPNRFLASVTPFISKHIDVKEIHDMVLGTFTAFFKRNIMQYTGYEAHKVNFVGSIAYYFRDVLEEAARNTGCTIGKVIKSPMEGLLSYHSEA
ncbi:MAG: ATPase [Muribaculaceae bacterium]|nr:ATPase [Muribaculaceae bacterium]